MGVCRQISGLAKSAGEHERTKFGKAGPKLEGLILRNRHGQNWGLLLRRSRRKATSLAMECKQP